jgi:hypothetical protein
MFKGKEADIDLIHAALLIARLTMTRWISSVSPRGGPLGKGLAGGAEADEAAKVAASASSCSPIAASTAAAAITTTARIATNEAGRSRRAPITLAVLYVELAARRVELKAPLGHFVVRHVPKKGDPGSSMYSRQPMSREEADDHRARDGRKPRDEDFKAATPKEVVVRICNLMGPARDGDKTAMRAPRRGVGATPTAERITDAGCPALPEWTACGRTADVNWLVDTSRRAQYAALSCGGC